MMRAREHCSTGDHGRVVRTDPSLQLWLDLIGVFVFALSGGLVAVRRSLDLFGVFVLAWIAGLGGGILRDLLLGVHPPVGVSDWRLLAAAVAAGALVFVGNAPVREFARSRPDVRIGRLTRSIRILDAAGLAVFAVSGATEAIEFNAPALAAVIIAGITAVGGGLLRDMLAGQVPEVLQRELYAIPALLGGVLIVALDATGHLSALTTWAVAVGIFALRVAAIRFDLNVPRPRGATS